MTKRYLALFALFAFAFIVFGDEVESLKELKQRKNELALKIHEKRVELIKANPALLALQRKIMDLHKELAIRLNNNPEMSEMLDQLHDLESKIQSYEAPEEE
jgi:hypothetical protein